MNQPIREGMNAEQKRALLKRLLQQRAAAEKTFGMSAQQAGLWHAFRRDPTATAYNVFLPSRVRSLLRKEKLVEAMRVLASRHHSLRTTFTDEGGQLKQTVQDTLHPEVVFHAVGQWDTDRVREAVLSETQRPFDLTKGPLLRLAVFEIGASDHVLVATTHHIITDFWSLVVLMEELRAIYPAVVGGFDPDLGSPTNNYHLHVQKQADLVDGPRCERLRDYWKSQVDGIDPVLALPTDFHRPPKFTHRGSTVPFTLDAAVSGVVRRFASEQGVTVNAVLLAAVQVVISLWTRQEHFLIGSPFAGRQSREFETTVGFFSNVLPIRCEVPRGVSLAELAKRTSQTLVAAMDHESYPLASIVQDANPVRDVSRHPLFQMLCTFENSQSSSDGNHASLLMPGTEVSETDSARVDGDTGIDLGGLRHEAFHVPHPTCHYDIEFAFDSSAQQISGQICYCVDLFERATVAGIASGFVKQLTGLLQQPTVSRKDVRIGPPSVVRGHATTVSDRLTGMLNTSFQRHASQFAVQHGDDRLTFDDLNQQAAAMEAMLDDAGIGQGDLVPVVAPSGPQVLPAILAVLRMGGVIVPIDQEQPSMAVEEVLQQTRAKAWLCLDKASWIVRVVDGVEDPLSLPNAAYVIFTSGSTGKPKGVIVGQDAIANTLIWRRDVVGLRHDDRVLMLLSHQFDAGFGVILQALVQGACLVWPQMKPSNFDLDQVVDDLVGRKIRVLIGGPSVLRMLAGHPRFDQCRFVRQVWTGGEAMPSDLPSMLRSTLRHDCDFWNFYGPTEAAIEASATRVEWSHDPKKPVTIGSPIHNTTVTLVDSELHPVPVGAPGQLAISGPGLADGYLNEPELTKAKFVVLPSSPPSRAYLTGDLARLADDRSIHFLGRMDQQVKLRGYRIELEEVDRHLSKQPGVTDAATCVVGQGADARLIAGIVGDDSKLDIRLPKFKRPDQVLVLERIPRGASGKVDRRSLADLAMHRMREESPGQMVVRPRNALESFLADQWCEVLGASAVSVNESFFDLGGSSLQAAMLTSKLSQELCVTVPTALLFDLADIRSMSGQLMRLYPDQIGDRFGVRSEDDADVEHSMVDPLIQVFRKGTLHRPLFMIHPPGGIVACYRDLADRIASDRSLHAVRSRGLHGDEVLPETLQAMAEDYARAIETVVGSEPISVGGWSLGGLVAVEVSAQLRRRGCQVERLYLLDTTIPEGATPLVSSGESSQVGLEYGIELSLDQLSELAPQDQLPFLYEHAKKLGVLEDNTPLELVQQTLQELQRLFHHHVSLANQYQLDRIETPITLFRPTEVPVQVVGPDDRGWSKLCADVNVIHVPGHHHSMLSPPHVDELAGHLRKSARPPASLSKSRQ